MDNLPTIIITGSSGLVGSALVSYFARRGFRVRAFQRTPCRHEIELVSCYPYDLADVRDNGFEGADYIVHCAYRPVISKQQRQSHINVDIEGTKRTIAYARAHGVKFILLSSTSAHPESRSYYARTKLLIEGLCDPNKDLILKLGLVLGGIGGLFGKIRSSLQRYALVPLVGGGRQRVQTIALDDLCRIVEVGIRNDVAGVFRIAHPRVVTMKELYRGIADSVGVHPVFVPVPLLVAYALACLMEALGFHPPFTSENVLGLKDLRVWDTASDLGMFSLNVMDWETALERSGRLS